MTSTGAFNQQFNLLLLEDSPEDREIYKRRLGAIPGIEFNITEAGNVENAKECIIAGDFDCYLIDYNLPDSNGLDFVRYLIDKKNDSAQAAALVIITGHGSEDVASEAFKLGVHEYLTKKAIYDGTLTRPILGAIERAQLTAQIQIVKNELERSNKALSEFTHTAAHDLKSPLRRILSYCEILQDEASGKLNEEENGILERIMVNAKRMRELVDSLLTYSLISAENEGKAKSDLKLLAEQTVDEFEPQLKETQGKVEVFDLPEVVVHDIRIRQLFQNLISNALKYKSDKPPHIIINSEDDGDYVIISVKDNGEGISSEHRKDIFKDFKRLHANEDIEGTGLGLSICKKIAELHGGDIWLESEPGVGSTFFIKLRKF